MAIEEETKPIATLSSSALLGRRRKPHRMASLDGRPILESPWSSLTHVKAACNVQTPGLLQTSSSLFCLDEWGGTIWS